MPDRLNCPMHDLSRGLIVVTGGAGLIGSGVIWGLNQRNLNNIWLVDEEVSSGPKEKNLKNLSFQKQTNPQDFRELVKRKSNELNHIQTVIHLGACSSTTESNEAFLNDNNLAYTEDLCLWSLSRKVRFVYASSAATYGDGSMGMDDSTEEIVKFQPLNLYGWSKQKFDLLAQENRWLDRIVGLKYFNVYGPNEEHKGNMRSVVSKAYEQITQTGEMSLFKSLRPDYGDGEQMRDFLYVKDAVNMTIWLTANNQANGLFNLGSGKARTWLDLGRSIFMALRKEPAIRFIDMPETLRDKYQYFTEANITKLKNAGYNSQLFDLEDAVCDYVRNYLMKDKRLGA